MQEVVGSNVAELSPILELRLMQMHNGGECDVWSDAVNISKSNVA